MSGAGLDGPDLPTLLAGRAAFIDVRAPKEFNRGSVPGAVNLPLLTDAERHQVGLAYKRSGRAGAMVKGNALINGAVKTERVDAWVRFAAQHDNVWVICWRGGLRSEIAQAWLRDRGVQLPRVPGGFRALRQACLSILESAPGQKRWLVLAGRTGSGKTEFIRQRAEGMDLEGFANHRGSAFGARPGGQPTPVTFENSLATAFVRHAPALLLLEDESKTIGRLALPGPWFHRMQQAALLVMEVPTETRIENICREYVQEPMATGTAPEVLLARYQAALDRIRRRLGGLRHREVSDALAEGFANGHHGHWIERLLSWYYDPMYDYQLGSKQSRVTLRGDPHVLHEYLDSLAAKPGKPLAR